MRRHHLTEADAIAQSIAAIAPTAAVTLIVPTVVASCGSSAPAAYLVATLGMVCLAVYVAPFSARVADAGSLYSYTRESLGPAAAMVAGWSLILAYLCSAAAAALGVALYSAERMALGGVSQVWCTMIVVVGVVLIATTMSWRDVRLSSRTMVFIESCSVALILILFCIPGEASLWHLQIPSLATMRPSAIGPGLSLAIFSFVGFESAACLGGEVQDPAPTMKRVLRTVVIISGVLFVLSAATEHHGIAGALAGQAPLEVLAAKQHEPRLGLLLLAGCAASFFACVLACISASARLFMQMGRDDNGVRWAGTLHSKFLTPHRGVASSCGAILFMLFCRFVVGGSLLDAYAWLADAATIGFLVSYAFVLVGTARLRGAEKSALVPSTLAGSLAGGTIAGGCWGLLQDSDSLYLRRIPIFFVLTIAVGIGVSNLSKMSFVRKSTAEE
jgi:amino acid transporter